MLIVKELRHSFGPQTLFEEVSFTLQPGEKSGLIGRNGTGKSTLFHLLSGLLEPEGGQVDKPKGYQLLTLDQHFSFNEKTTLDELLLVLHHDLTRQWEAEKIAHGLGMNDNHLKSAPSELSSGYQMRLALARLLLSGANCLLLDEPTNYLDAPSIHWLSQFLRQWQGEFILISHDRGFLDSVCNSVLGIHRQRVKKINGSTGKYYEQIQQEEAVHEQTRLNNEKKKKETEVFISKFRAKARMAGMVQSRVKALEKQDIGRRLEKITELNFSFPYHPFPAKIAMEFHNLSFKYPEQDLLFSSLEGYIARGDRVAVMGANGRGKSTLLKLFNRELDAESGTLKFHPEARVGYFGPSAIEALNDQHTIEQSLYSRNPKLSQREIRSAAGLMMFGEKDIGKTISVLSGGEKSRVQLANLLLQKNNILLLDEPTNHLDVESVDALIEALQEFEGVVWIVSHSEYLVEKVANRLILFEKEGVRFFQGSLDEYYQKFGTEQLLHTEKSTEKKVSINKLTRHERAELVRERSARLKPVNQKIHTLEESIERMEKEQENIEIQLIEASKNAESQEIQSLSQKLSHLQNELESAYDTLGTKYAKKEGIEEYYQEKLNEVAL